MTDTRIPKSYGDWQQLFSALTRNDRASGGASLRDGLADLAEIPWEETRCEGFAAVRPAFAARLTDTVNAIVTRIAGTCTTRLNAAIAEHDFSRMETVFRRCDRSWEQCRFYREIPFLPGDFRQELDESVQGERRRYWTEMTAFLEEAAEETGSSELQDLCELARRIRRRIAAAESR